MIEILPIGLLTEEDAPVFGKLNVALGKLHRLGFPVGAGFVVTVPEFKLKTLLEKFDFGTKEIFEQSLTLVKKEIFSISLPELLIKETSKHKKFYLNGEIYKSVKDLWQGLLTSWIEQIKERLWNRGFYSGISEGLDPQIVIFIKKLQNNGSAYFDPLQDDVIITAKKDQLHPNDSKKIFDLVTTANKKLFIPHEYKWIEENGIKLVGVSPVTPVIPLEPFPIVVGSQARPCEATCAVRVFVDSQNYIQAQEVQGNESYENMVLKLVETASSFPESPVFFKLADKSEGLGKLRGTLRLMHQKSLLDPMVEALDFARHKKNLTNIHIVIPFVRGVGELIQIKRELAAGKLARKNSLQIWMEVCTPENIINLDKYLEAGIDGVVLNLNELIAFCNGFDPAEPDLAFYKSEIEGLLIFLEDALKLLHKSKIPFIASGSLTFESRVLEFLVEKGVYGVVAEKYEAHSVKDLLYQVEKRIILRRS